MTDGERPGRGKRWTCPIQVGFTPEQKERVQRAADAHGMSFSSWARPLLVAAANAQQLRDSGEKVFSRLDLFNLLGSAKETMKQTDSANDDVASDAVWDLALVSGPQLVACIEYLLSLLQVDVREPDISVAAMVWCRENATTANESQIPAANTENAEPQTCDPQAD